MKTVKIEMWLYEKFEKDLPAGKTVEEAIFEHLNKLNDVEIVHVTEEK